MRAMLYFCIVVIFASLIYIVIYLPFINIGYDNNIAIAEQAMEIFSKINQKDLELGYANRDLFNKSIGDIKIDQEFLTLLRNNRVRVVKWGDLNKTGDVNNNEIAMMLFINNMYYAFSYSGFKRIDRDDVIKYPSVLPEQNPNLPMLPK